MGSNNEDMVAPAIIAGIIVIIWVYSSARLQYLLLYGYGELIDKVSDLEARSQGGKKGGRKPQRPAESHTEPNAEPEPEPEPAEDALVDVCTYLPGVYADLRYATENNFTGQVIYDFTQPQLRYGTLKKLAQAQEMLAERDLALKIWDAYRPVSAQFRLWEVCPDPQYVADPTKDYSGHSRGNTVDVTLVSADGSPVPMPTDFDDFTAMADRDYSDVSDTAAYDNVRLLEDTMVSCGFRPYSAEWWHFTDTTDYPVVEE